MPAELFLPLLNKKFTFQNLYTLQDIKKESDKLFKQLENTGKAKKISFNFINEEQEIIKAAVQKRMDEINNANKNINQVLNVIKKFKVYYSDLLDSESVEVHREKLLKQIAKTLDDKSNLLNKAYATLNLTEGFPDIKKAVTQKLDAIYNKAKNRKSAIASDQALNPSAQEDALRYRLTREDIEILIVNKKKKRAINCHVIDGAVPCSVSDFLENIVQKGQKRTQLIFKVATTEHWSTMDILRHENGTLSIFFIDAIGHKTNMPEVVAFCDVHQFELTQSLGGIQKDFASCSVFCADHAFHMSKIPDLHEQINAVRTKVPGSNLTYEVDPMNLPPVLVKNVQSTGMIKNYLQKHPEQGATPLNKKEQTLINYAESHHIMIEGQKIYNAVGYKQSKYRKRINQDKGYEPEPNYQEKMLQSALAIIERATHDILNIKLDDTLRNTANDIVFYYHALSSRIEEIITSRDMRDAQTILNLRGHPKLLMETITQKKQEISTAMHNQMLRIVKQDAKKPSIKATETQNIFNRVKLLHTLHFEAHIASFNAIAIKDESAAQSIYKLCSALENAKQEFILANLKTKLPELKKILADKCQSALNAAKNTLGTQSNFGEAYEKFLNKVLSNLIKTTSPAKLSIFSHKEPINNESSANNKFQPR
jgi:esterase/lipase